MSVLADEVAQHLQPLLEWWEYRPGSLGGNIFIDHMPDKPAAAVAVFHQPGPPPDDQGYGYDRAELQFIVRGAASPAGRQQAQQRATAVRSALAGASSLTLPGGTTVIAIHTPTSGPLPIGTDEAGRPEYTVTLEVEVVALTAHRPHG